jgi:hypothetical protein
MHDQFALTIEVSLAIADDIVTILHLDSKESNREGVALFFINIV